MQESTKIGDSGELLWEEIQCYRKRTLFHISLTLLGMCVCAAAVYWAFIAMQRWAAFVGIAGAVFGCILLICLVHLIDQLVVGPIRTQFFERAVLQTSSRRTVFIPYNKVESLSFGRAFAPGMISYWIILEMPPGGSANTVNFNAGRRTGRANDEIPGSTSLGQMMMLRDQIVPWVVEGLSQRLEAGKEIDLMPECTVLQDGLRIKPKASKVRWEEIADISLQPHDGHWEFYQAGKDEPFLRIIEPTSNIYPLLHLIRLRTLGIDALKGPGTTPPAS